MTRTLGVALGGGGARGIAHIGVLQALEEERIPIHAVSGTSIGSVVGALYAYYRNSKKVREHFSEFMKSDTFHRMGFHHIEQQHAGYEPGLLQQFTKIVAEKVIIKMNAHKLGIISAEKMENFLQVLFGDIRFESLNIPFAACAANLIDGSGRYFSEGNIVEAVAASSSIPGWVEPVMIDGFPYVDGIIYESVPVRALDRFKVDRIIAIDVTKRNFSKMPLHSAIDVVSRTDHILKNHLTDRITAEADLCLHPDTHGYEWYEYSHFEELMFEGRKAVREKLPEIRRLMQE